MKIKTVLIGLVSGIFNGLFGAGGGTIVVPCMQKFLHVETHKSHASSLAVILPLTIISAIVYFNTDMQWDKVLFLSIGGVFGGFIGAKILKKIKPRWLHRIFGLFMIAAAVRMII